MLALLVVMTLGSPDLPLIEAGQTAAPVCVDVLTCR